MHDIGHHMSLQDIIKWPADRPLPPWCKQKLATINTQQFPDKVLLNACSEAVQHAGPNAVRLPEVCEQWRSCGTAIGVMH